jgi:hypothetical protein
LSLQWDQIEDTRKGLRNVIAYQKYFFPLQTQRILSENYMHMAEAKNDYAFIEYQQDLFQKQLTKIADLCIYASSR